jgi:hypothetical protein
MRNTREHLSRFHQTYPILFNIVDARNESHLRWLKRVGFAVGERLLVGKGAVPFYFFSKVNDPCAMPPHSLPRR